MPVERAMGPYQNNMIYQATLLPETVAKFGPQRNQANYTITS